MERLKDWAKNHVSKFDKYNVNTLSNLLFFREEIRPIIRDRDSFLSPADGIVLYAKIVDKTKNEKVVEVKGENYTIEEILGGDNILKSDKALVVGVFMTFYDIHVNRMPTDGLLRYEFIDSISSKNLPMLAVETGIFENDMNYAYNNMDYLKNNERMLNTIYIPRENYEYYVVQIADEDVDVICPFSTKQNDDYAQGDRFSFIRWGSQVDLILPIYDDLPYDFKVCVLPGHHVKGCEDILVQKIWKDDPYYEEEMNYDITKFVSKNNKNKKNDKNKKDSKNESKK